MYYNVIRFLLLPFILYTRKNNIRIVNKNVYTLQIFGEKLVNTKIVYIIKAKLPITSSIRTDE